MSNGLDLWERLERSATPPVSAVPPESDEEQQSEKGSEQGRRPFRRILRLLDILGVLFWGYAITKVFFVDIDRILLRRIAPHQTGLDYRFFFYLVLVALAVIFFRRWWLAFLYIIFFPLVVTLWKIPTFFVKRRSWALFIGALQAAFTVFGDFKYNFLTKSLGLVAAMVIMFSDTNTLLVMSALFIAGLLGWSFIRLLRRTFSSSAFLRIQKEKIGRVMSSDRVKSIALVSEELKDTQIERYSETQVQQITSTISVGVLMNRTLYLWAYQLERYRKSYSPGLFFNSFAYLWICLGTMMSFALLNYSVLKVDPSQFNFDHRPSFIAVLVHSLGTLALAGAGGFSAHGDLAYWIEFGAGLAGPTVLATFLLNVLVTSRRERDDAAMRDLVAELKTRAKEQEA